MIINIKFFMINCKSTNGKQKNIETIFKKDLPILRLKKVFKL